MWIHGITVVMGTPSPSVQVVESVAEKESITPGQLSPPLYETIDPDALDTLFTSSTPATGTVEFAFEYCGYKVHILKSDASEESIHIEVTPVTESQAVSEVNADTLD